MSATTLAAVPLLDTEVVTKIGGDQSNDTRFSNINAIEADSAGNIYVLDALEHSVRVFGADGKLVRRFGRRGGGPGEMNSPWRLLLRHDTLFVMDDHLLHRFTPEGKYIGRVAYQLRFHDKKWGDYSLVPNTLDNGGNGIVASAKMHTMMVMPKEPRTDTTSLFFLDPADGSVSKPFQQIESNLFYTFGGAGYRNALFAPESDFAIMRDGRVLVTDRDGTGIDEFRDGKKLRRVVYVAKRKEVTTADIDTLSERHRKGLEELSAREDFQDIPAKEIRASAQAIRKLPHYRYLPTIAKLVAADDGTLLVHRPDLSETIIEWRRSRGKTTWDVLDTKLMVVGRVVLPSGFYPMIKRGDVIVGTMQDENEVPTIVALRLARPRPADQ